MADELDDLFDAAAIAVKVRRAGRPGTETLGAVRLLTSIESMVGAARLDAIAALDTSREWSADGQFRTAGSFLAWDCHLPPALARSQVALARKLVQMPATFDALADGAIHLEHVKALVRVNLHDVADLFAEAEADLVQSARDSERFDAFTRKLRDWYEQVEPDQADDDATARLNRRGAHCSQTLDDMFRLDAWLDPIGGTIFDDELQRLSGDELLADWAEARARVGDKATIADLLRTPAQRRADALVNMAARSKTADPNAKQPVPLLHLRMDCATFYAEMAALLGIPFEGVTPNGDRVCELRNGTPIPPRQALGLALQGHIRRVVFSPDGSVLDYGRSKRLFTGALRDAIIERDQICTVPGCGLPAHRCEIDHIIEWEDGGTTSERNGDTKCDHHNRWKNRRKLRLRRRGPP